MSTIRTTSYAVFACHTAACSPPPVGSGGSSKSGTSRAARVDAAYRKARPLAKVTLIARNSPHYTKREAADVMPLSEADAVKLIRDSDVTGRRVLDKGHSLSDGQAVGVRANLNVKKTTGITVQTIHAGTDAQLSKGTGMFAGEAIGYAAAVTLRNVNFSVNQVARHKIATKQSNKFPMASVDGKYVAEDVSPRYNNGRSERFDGVEITFNPMKNHTFVDPDGRAVKGAAVVTVVGSKVYARGAITYYSAADMPKALGDVPSSSSPVEGR